MLRLASMFLMMSAVITAGSAARADTQQEDVLACFAGIGTSTDWNQCLNIMFAPCASEAVGSSGHLNCLGDQREDWQAAKIGVEGELLSRLTDDGLEELSGLMLAWPKFVEDKCKAVAEARVDISAAAAGIGCRISELALLTNEMTACLDGNSSEPYCQLSDR